MAPTKRDKPNSEAEVVHLVTTRGRAQQHGSELAVTMLEDLLRDARAGKISSIASVVEYGFGEAATTKFYFTPMLNNVATLKMSGAIDVLKNMVVGNNLQVTQGKSR